MKLANEAANAALVSSAEERQIVRNLLAHLNTCPSLPAGSILFEQLGAGVHGMAFHVERAAFILSRFIVGGYRAEIRFSLLYRIQPGSSNLERIEADEALGSVGDWLTANPPALGGNCHPLRVEVLQRPAARTAWDNGDEDHTIPMRLIYDVL